MIQCTIAVPSAIALLGGVVTLAAITVAVGVIGGLPNR